MGQILLTLNLVGPWSYWPNCAFGPDGVQCAEFSHLSKTKQVTSKNLHEVIDWITPSLRVYIYSVLLIISPGIINIWCITWHPQKTCTHEGYWLSSWLCWEKKVGGLIQQGPTCLSLLPPCLKSSNQKPERYH